MSTLGTIVATDTRTGLKVIFHLIQEDDAVAFRRPEIKNWHHRCDPAIKIIHGFFEELEAIEDGRFCELEFFEISPHCHNDWASARSYRHQTFDPKQITDRPSQGISPK